MDVASRTLPEPRRKPGEPGSTPRRPLSPLPTQQERHDLAEIVLRRDIRSWSQLSRQDIARLIDTLEGHALVQHLLDTRPPKEQQ